MTETVAQPVGARVPLGDPRFFQVLQALWDEAELLDRPDLAAWRAWLAPDIYYEIPVRTTRELANTHREFSETTVHAGEDLGGIDLRIAWSGTGTWAENPQPRTRHYVSNVRVHETAVADELAVRSYVLVVRNRFDDPTLRLLSADRHDIVRLVDGELKLARRRILVDQTTIDLDNLAFFM